MNGRLVLIKGLIALAVCGTVSPLAAVVVACGVSELPKDNRCIVVRDYHIAQDPRDRQQLDVVEKALLDRVKITQRPLYVLSESSPHWVRSGNGHSVMRSLKEHLSVVALDDDSLTPFIHIEDVEIRKLNHVVGAILRDKAIKKEYNEKRRLFWDVDNFEDVWFVGEPSFKDIAADFDAQIKQATSTYNKLLALCGQDNEKTFIERYYQEALSEAWGHVRKYLFFLKEKGIDPFSEEKIYKTTYEWPEDQKEIMDRFLLNWYNPFFDFNAYARIVSLHKQHESIDIMFIAGDLHGEKAWAKLSSSPSLKGEELYAQSYDSRFALEAQHLSNDILYTLFQKEAPKVEVPLEQMELIELCS